MNEQNQRDSIMSMARGAFEERVDYEMDKVIQNILDPNTKATAKRKITLTIELTPDDERRTIGVSVTAKSTLAATNPVATALYFGTGEVREWYRELGLYAEDPDPEVGEVLYCYGNCGDLAEWIPPSGGATIVEKTIDIVTAIGTATNVTAYIPADAYATKEDYETYKAIALGAKATAEEALALARQAIAIAQAAEASANDLSNAVGQNTSKIATLWDAVFSDITSNPFQITFADLTGITLKSGVWNASLQRLEC